MVEADLKEPIYIVISQTGTVLSRLLKLITGADYNHASLALSSKLDIMYSFGRKNPYNPFWAGFVTESPHFGTFKRFSNTRVIVLELNIEREKYSEIENTIKNMLECKKDYGYNYLGLYLAAIKVVHKSYNRYYCSEFVRDLLLKYEVEGAKELADIIRPVDFLTLPYITEIFTGKLSDYSKFYQMSLLTPKI